MPEQQIDAFVVCNEPVAFRVGSAEILGQFRINNDSLVVELAHIDGGGEGVLPTIWSLAERYATKKELQTVEWIVHAVDCAEPNPRLRRVLELRGFKIENVSGVGEAFHSVQRVGRRAV